MGKRKAGEVTQSNPDDDKTQMQEASDDVEMQRQAIMRNNIMNCM
jgi:hypothetical protein